MHPEGQGEELGHPGGKVARASVSEASWTPPWRDVRGMSHREEEACRMDKVIMGNFIKTAFPLLIRSFGK